MEGSVSFASPIVFCFLFDRERVLLLKRLVPPYSGTVTVPGGKKEPGETSSEACVREMREETGYEILAPRLRAVLHLCSEERERTAFYFSSRLFSGELKESAEGLPFWAGRPESLHVPGVNPFYSLLAPRMFDESLSFFEGSVTADRGGEILSVRWGFSGAGQNSYRGGEEY